MHVENSVCVQEEERERECVSVRQREEMACSGSHRGAASFSCFLQVMIVGQDLHEEVQLKSLRLQRQIVV